MREKDLERKLKKEVQKRGGLCLKWVSPGFSGVPDRIVILEDKILFIELKRPGLSEKARSPRQNRVAAHFKALGHDIIFISEETDIYEVL